MGFNTTVFILNDGLSDIEKHPDEFVQVISDKIMTGGTGRVGCHLNCVEVMPTAHADTYRLYGTHQNSMIELSRWNDRTRALVESHPEVVKSFIDKARDELNSLEGLLGWVR